MTDTAVISSNGRGPAPKGVGVSGTVSYGGVLYLSVGFIQRLVKCCVVTTRQRLQVQRVAAMTHVASVFSAVMKNEPDGHFPNKQFVGESMRVDVPSPEVGFPVSGLLGEMTQERPAGIIAARTVNVGPEDRFGILLGLLPTRRALAGAELAPALRDAPLAWHERASAQLAGTGILGGHCRDSFGDVAPPADFHSARGYFVPELYQIRQGA